MKYFALLLSLALVACGTNRSSEQNSKDPKAQLQQDIELLASDSLEGRQTGTEGEKMAADYIGGRMANLGLQAKGDSSYFQDFTKNPKAVPHKMDRGDSTTLGMGTVKPVTGRNVIGYLDKNAEKTIVIGAHYDHLGYGGAGSLFTGDSAIHNGADDNASGVAALLLLAERLKQKELNNNVLFIAFSGEENGLWGSNYFTKNPTIPLEEINYMLNMDMVGRLKEDRTVAINGVGTSPAWMPMLDSISVDSIKIVTTESGVGPSDHTSFYNEGLPVLHFFTGQHEDYHKPTDDFDKINYEGILSVVEFMETVIENLEDDGKLEFTKTKDQSASDTPAFKVTLGVVPDYLFDGEGMRIDGTSDGRPAANAGIQKGDVVVQMGDLEITDMMTYMEALGKFEPGQTVEVKVKRDGEIKSFDVTFD
ncbi:M20/M25/M40 family metallo-hydrolase [Halocola ammonii]